MVHPSPERSTQLALHIELLKAVDSGNLDNLECPKCRHRAVSAWFTNPEPEVYGTWLICADCGSHSYAINSTRPSSFTPKQGSLRLAGQGCGYSQSNALPKTVRQPRLTLVVDKSR